MTHLVRPKRVLAILVATALVLALSAAAALANTVHIPKPATLEGSVFMVTVSTDGIHVQRLADAIVEIHGPPDAKVFSSGSVESLGEYAAFNVPAGLYAVDVTTFSFIDSPPPIDCTPTEKGALDGTGRTFAVLQLAAGQTVLSNWYCRAPSA